MKQSLRTLVLKGLAVLLAFTVILLPYTAEAKVIGYVTQGGASKLYEYDYDELVRAFVFSSSSNPQPLYSEYLKGETKYLLDDVNGYVDYHEAVRAFVFSSGSFDLNAYTSGPNAKIADVDKVNVVTVENGKLKFTEKIIVPPVELALAEVNAADTASDLRSILESNSNVLGLSLSNYNKLSSYGKTLAVTKILERRGDGFSSANALKSVFDEEVKALVDNPTKVVLHEINSVKEASTLRSLLEDNASLLGLSLSNYNTLTSTGKNSVVSAVLERRGDGFADTGALNSVFTEEVDKAISSAERILGDVNAADDLAELEQVLLADGKAAGLEVDAYNLIISSRNESVLSTLFASRPFGSVDSLRNTFNSEVASVLTSYVVISYTDYDYSIQQMVNTQMGVSAKPQISSGGGWQNATSDEVRHYVDPDNFILEDLVEEHVAEVIIASGPLRIRENPTTDSANLGQAQVDEIFTVEDRAKGLEGTAAGTEGYWFKITRGDVTGWVSGLFTDLVAEDFNSTMFQFLSLSGPSGATVNDLALILNEKGILHGTEEAFYQAAQENNINEIFLVSLALHETGNGNSVLANGQEYNGETVYNMFGIGAHDSNPNYLGARRAYNEGWFTPELAIAGGAVFASNNYVNHSSYRQDTLYKMRWNPGSPGSHQYATDVGWARKQTSFITRHYDVVNIYNLRFDIPRYKPE
ncbi:MAG: hypothetical protein FH749_14635 [Firmicutes bacterium]|nr:hypothetical protein [Bacillota bacterium]